MRSRRRDFCRRFWMDDWGGSMSKPNEVHQPPLVLSYASQSLPPAGGAARWFALSNLGATLLIVLAHVLLRDDQEHLEPPIQFVCGGILVPAFVTAIGTAIAMWAASVRASTLGPLGVRRG